MPGEARFVYMKRIGVWWTGESLSLNRQRVWKSLELLDRQLSGVVVACVVVSLVTKGILCCSLRDTVAPGLPSVDLWLETPNLTPGSAGSMGSGF